MRLAQSIFVAVALLSLAACSGSESPTNPSAAPRIQLTVQVDGRAAADAIPGVSEVAVSAPQRATQGR
jgi:hypothetical protein